MHIQKAYVLKGHVYIKRYSKRSFGAPSKKRARKEKESPEAMKNYNNQKRSEKLQLLILNNFDKGFHVTLDYPVDKRPQTYKEAEENLTKVLHKVSRRLKKQGIQFKYIGVTERGKRAAALHHHLIIEGHSQILEELMGAWGRHMKVLPMYEDGCYKDLADYLVKIETKEEQTKGKSKYHRSRNLKEPIEKMTIRAGAIENDPKIPEGYELVNGSLVNGFNEIVGVRYQKYMLRETEKPKGEQKGKRKKSLFGLIRKVFEREKHED